MANETGVQMTLKGTRWGRVDLVYSPDDEGYYAQLWADMDTVSEVYGDRDELIAALYSGEVRGLPSA